MNTVVRVVEWCSRWYDAAAVVVAAVILVAITVIVFWEVISRYLLDQPLSWSEEVASYAFAWLIFLGGTIGIRAGDAPALRALVERLPGVVSAGAERFSYVLGCVLSGYLAWYGYVAADQAMAQRTPATQIPYGYVMAIMPIAAVGFFIHFLNHLLRSVALSRQLLQVLVFAVVSLAGLRFAPAMHAPGWAYLIGGLAIGFALGLPVAFVLIFASVLTTIGANIGTLTIVPQELIQGGSNFILLAVPLFMLTGAIMLHSGMSERLVGFASIIAGRFRGGLLLVDVFASALFADISGSPVADTAAMGSVMLPGMIKKGYDRSFATAVQAAAGTLGTMFPPSIATIIYAYVAEVSVSKMFLASFLPGFLLLLSFCVVIYVTARRRDFPREPAVSARQAAKTFGSSFPVLLAPIIIVGSILSGIVTPAEAGVIAVAYTTVCGMTVYRQLRPSTLWRSLREGVATSSRVMLILSSAILLGYILTFEQIPQHVASGLLGLSHHPLMLFLVLNLVLVLVHSVLETSSTIILIVPLVMPAFVAAGVDPIHLGIVFLANSAVGLLTPPIGFLLYIAAPISGIKVEQLIRAVVPFLLALAADVVILVVFPQISTLVPSLL